MTGSECNHNEIAELDGDLLSTYDIATAPTCIPWEIAIKDCNPRIIHLLDKYGGCFGK